ncbi:hypothetical protein GCM10009799_26320 [Nocardiopsis rhodophaea]|uniref:Uncharacterized protein n=1 Tax=Nocardiopsis rhodophaea TaxID=280238 RepID=A0ABN2T3N9_9ACTN
MGVSALERPSRSARYSDVGEITRIPVGANGPAIDPNPHGTPVHVRSLVAPATCPAAVSAAIAPPRHLPPRTRGPHGTHITTPCQT